MRSMIFSYFSQIDNHRCPGRARASDDAEGTRKFPSVLGCGEEKKEKPGLDGVSEYEGLRVEYE